MARPPKSYQYPNTKLVQQIYDYLDYCQYALNYTLATIQDKRRSLLHFAVYSQLECIEDLSTDLILRYIAYQTKNGNMPRTVNDRVKHLKAMVNYYLDLDVKISNLNLRKVHRQHEDAPKKRAFKREVIYNALRYADRETWLIIKLAFDCGLRIEELRNIRLEDIDDCKINVLGKGRKRRFVIMSPEARSRLDDLIIKNGITDYIFASPRYKNRPRSQESIRRQARKAFAAAGVDHFCMHELRHSYATDLKRLGATTRQIQQGLGHSSEKITEMYLHDLDASSLDEVYKLKYSVENSNLR